MSWLLGGVLMAPAMASYTSNGTTPCERAEVIVVGEVTAVSAEYRQTDIGKLIYSTVSVQNDRALKGMPASEIQMEFLGGTVGDIGLSVANNPRVEVGEWYLWLLVGNEDGVYRMASAERTWGWNPLIRRVRARRWMKEVCVLLEG